MDVSKMIRALKEELDGVNTSIAALEQLLAAGHREMGKRPQTSRRPTARRSRPARAASAAPTKRAAQRTGSV